MKNIIITLLCLLVYGYNYAVSTSQLTISAGSNWQDAVLYQDTRPGYEHLSNNNYKDDLRLSAVAWTHSGKPIYRRSLIRFNLNQLPANAVIQSAVLYFYSDPTVTSSSSANRKQPVEWIQCFFY